MRGGDRKRVKIIEREIAIARGVKAVRGGARKTKFLRQSLAIDRQRAAGERARSHGAGVSRCARCFHSFDVAEKNFGVSQQKMGKQNRLGVLQVRHAGHRHIEILRGLLDERADEASQSR